MAFTDREEYCAERPETAGREESVQDEQLEVLLRDESGDRSAFEALEKALDAAEREIVILHVLWGYKHREIAERLKMPLGTVTSKYKTSLAKLKAYLKEEL